MKSIVNSLLKLCHGACFILTSLYCLLAFIPYTFLFLVKEPPYEWLIHFVRYHRFVYWLAFAAGMTAYWSLRKNRWVRTACLLQLLLGIFFSFRNFLPNIQNNWIAYFMGMATLLALLPAVAAGAAAPEVEEAEGDNNQRGLFSYSNTVVAAVLVAVVSITASLLPGRLDQNLFTVPGSAAELGILVFAGYLWFALLAVSIANLLLVPALRKVHSAARARGLVIGLLIFVALWIASTGFLQQSLTFRGWPPVIYGGLLGLALVLLGFVVLRPLFGTHRERTGKQFKTKLPLYLLGLAASLAAIAVPRHLQDADWNGLFQGTVALLLWIILPIVVFALRPRLKSYSVPGILGVIAVAGMVYWGLSATAFLWARSVGPTDGAISRALDGYAAENVSFGISRRLFHGGIGDSCDEFCGTLRQYTNIRGAELKFDVNLVDQLAPATLYRPNIFVIVVDSLRADYLGAYNPKVDFTPHFDELARDSTVITNAYTQYAGTTLSEAALWTGTLLLHAHYAQPFSRVNNLEKLLRTDGYQIVVSYDSVLRQILTDKGDLIRLDLNKPWNEFELSSSIQQLESFLDNRSPGDSRPVFFYSQPLNIHMFARNKLPVPSPGYRANKPGFNGRIVWELQYVDRFLGDFVQYLKTRGLYDDSIIVITADHGEGTAELGHESHSTVIFPEVMRVPLIIHLPSAMRKSVVYEPDSIASLIDVTPTLYYLLGHKPIKSNTLFGRPIFVQSLDELQQYPRPELFLASDVRAAYGLLVDNGRLMFVTYDSPPRSFLWDIKQDPNATQNILSEADKKRYQQEVVDYLQQIAHFYDYKPSGSAR